jgi:hypothetical protein
MLPAPSGVQWAADLTNNSIVISWDEVPNAIEYRLFRMGSTVPVYKGPALIGIDPNVQNSKHLYQYYVQAYNEFTMSPNSELITAKSPSAFPKCTFKLNNPVIVGNTVTLTWNKCGVADTYEINKISNDNAALYHTAQPIFVDADVYLGNSYTYVVFDKGQNYFRTASVQVNMSNGSNTTSFQQLTPLTPSTNMNNFAPLTPSSGNKPGPNPNPTPAPSKSWADLQQAQRTTISPIEWLLIIILILIFVILLVYLVSQATPQYA